MTINGIPMIDKIAPCRPQFFRVLFYRFSANVALLPYSMEVRFSPIHIGIYKLTVPSAMQR